MKRTINFNNLEAYQSIIMLQIRSESMSFISLKAYKPMRMNMDVWSDMIKTMRLEDVEANNSFRILKTLRTCKTSNAFQ